MLQLGLGGPGSMELQRFLHDRATAQQDNIINRKSFNGELLIVIVNKYSEFRERKERPPGALELWEEYYRINLSKAGYCNWIRLGYFHH